MPIELRVLTGSRAGQSETIDSAIVSIGRSKDNRFRFDPKTDLDVSSRHAEIRLGFSGFTIVDLNSTNGTFVNGKRVLAEQVLRDGDIISFGVDGPQVSFHDPDAGRRSGGVTPRGTRAVTGEHESATGPRTRPTPVHRPTPTPITKPPMPAARLGTVERVAIAVREQTKGLRRALAASVLALAVLGAGGYWAFRAQSARAEATVRLLVHQYEESSREIHARLQGMNDTSLTNELRRMNDSLTKVAVEARTASAQRDLRRHTDLQLRLSQMDLAAVRAANDHAVVLVASELGGRVFEGTGFSVTSGGLIATNRHVVQDADNRRATRVGVKFANTTRWMPARVVHVATDEADDLALIQVDERGTFPTVASLGDGGVDVPVGSPIASIGFPLGTDIPMDGATARTTLTAGYVSKTLPDLLQIDSFAGHGSSGSPVFDAHGHVIGVIWGGAPGVGGRIVYAVPSDRLVALMRAAGVR